MLLAASFALATPIGILVGAAILVSQMGAWSHLLMAAAAGTFVYVALFEFMPPPTPTPTPNPTPTPTPTPPPTHILNHNPNPHLCEVMPRELHSTRAARGAQLTALLAGFAMMAVLKIWV